MARPSLATWLLPTAALLCAVGCKHEPDIVAEIQASSAMNGGMSGGAAGSSAGTGTGTGMGGAGAGSSASNAAGSGGSIDAGSNAGTDAEDDAGDDAGSGAGDGGSQGGSGRGNPIENCPTPQFYWTMRTIVDNECKFSLALLPVVDAFLKQVPPEVPVGESRLLGYCDITGGPYYGTDDGRVGLCDNACNGAKEWLKEQEDELKRCMGLLDDGSAGAP